MRKNSRDNLRRSAKEQQSFSVANTSQKIKQELQNKIKDSEFKLMNGLTKSISDNYKRDNPIIRQE
jgi:hypothetical protein